MVTLFLFFPAVGCSANPSDSNDGPSSVVDDTADPACGGYSCVEPESQREGDAAQGAWEVLNGDYVTCGIPRTAYNAVFGAASSSMQIAGRDDRNGDLPYYFTEITTASGVDVVTSNCLACHAGRVNGDVVVGLGTTDWNFTTDSSQTAAFVPMLVSDPDEKAEAERWADRMKATAPYLVTTTVGQNPANNLFAALAAHRDPDTLAWSDEPLMDMPELTPVPADVPPWWRVKKKNALYSNASGRGDQAHLMMTASTLCTDTVDEAARIDATFPDVRAYVASIEAPAWPWPIDDAKAQRGQVLFDANCARCHGTYVAAGEPDDNETYPNLLVPLDVIGTDPQMADGDHYAQRFVDWYNASWYGQQARLEPGEGYMAPPLDGIWATAPFLHNGSVPTLWDMLDSTHRPTYWTRTFDSSDYDETKAGWDITVLDHGQADMDPADRVFVIDTTLFGMSNVGHTFGDLLTDDERSDLVEYLKTL